MADPWCYPCLPAGLTASHGRVLAHGEAELVLVLLWLSGIDDTSETSGGTSSLIGIYYTSSLNDTAIFALL